MLTVSLGSENGDRPRTFEDPRHHADLHASIRLTDSGPYKGVLMRLLPLACCCVAFLPGCTGQPAAPPEGLEPAGPGRFAHSAIHKTSAPWDGAAIQLFLAEKPLPRQVPVAPFVSICIYRAGTELSKQRVRLDGTESRRGRRSGFRSKGRGRLSRGWRSPSRRSRRGSRSKEPMRSPFRMANASGAASRRSGGRPKDGEGEPEWRFSHKRRRGRRQ